MGFWNFMGQSLGLLGRVMRFDNKERRFGSDQNYLVVQVEHDGKAIKDTSTGEEEVLLMTDHEFETMRDRARANPEDVKAFLEANKVRDGVD